MIQWIVRICDVKDRFLWEPFWFFPKNFLNFISDMTKKQDIINVWIYSSKSYAAVVLCDSEVTFLKEEEDAAFCLYLYGLLFIDNIA